MPVRAHLSLLDLPHDRALPDSLFRFLRLGNMLDALKHLALRQPEAEHLRGSVAEVIGGKTARMGQLGR